MKFILKNPLEKIDFWVVTTDMVNLFEKIGIKYSELSRLGKMSNKVTFDEIGSFFLLQDILSERLGKPKTPMIFEANNPAEFKIIERVIFENKTMRQYFIELLQKHNTYFYRNFENGLIIQIAEKGAVELDHPGWTILEGDKLSIALMDTLFKFFGYQDLHYSSVIQTGPDEFTLSNAFYALEQGL